MHASEGISQVLAVTAVFAIQKVIDVGVVHAVAAGRQRRWIGDRHVIKTQWEIGNEVLSESLIIFQHPQATAVVAHPKTGVLVHAIVITKGRIPVAHASKIKATVAETIQVKTAVTEAFGNGAKIRSGSCGRTTVQMQSSNVRESPRRILFDLAGILPLRVLLATANQVLFLGQGTGRRDTPTKGH